jgi:hypothetical protein
MDAKAAGLSRSTAAIGDPAPCGGARHRADHLIVQHLELPATVLVWALPPRLG